MPVYMSIDRLERTVTMVAHGTVTDQEIRDVTQQLIDEDVPAFGKIIDTSAAVSDLTDDQVAVVAKMLREAPGYDRRGPVAYVIDPDRVGFAHRFAAASSADRPIKLFTSVREARRWVAEVVGGASAG